MSRPGPKSKSTLVIGAGELGMAMLRALIEAGTAEAGSLSVLLRPSGNGSGEQTQEATIRELGVTIVRADLASDTVEELARVMEPFPVVICCTGFVGGPGTQRKITEAVLAARVQRYVPWQFGVDYDVVGRGSGQPVWVEQLDVRELLRAQSRTRWTIVSTGMFTSFLFEPSFGLVDLEQGRVSALGSWDNRLTVTIPDDVGRLTAAILAHDPPIDDAIVFVAGDTFSYAQLADMVEDHLERDVERVLWSMEALRSDLDAHPNDPMRVYHLAFAREDGVAWDKTRSYNAEQQIAVTDVPSWLNHRKAA